MNNWKETTLEQIANINMGQSPKSDSYNVHGDGLPFYQGVTEFSDKYVKIKTYTNSPTKIADQGDILFSVRAPVGRVNFTNNKCCIGRGNAALKMKNGNQEFLFYLLKYLERNIKNFTSGTVFDSISGVELRRIEVSVPESSSEQKAIAGVLSGFDDKIELLRKQNETLEKTAQTIFKEWFVNFNFLNKDGKPYKKSGGKMIDSELGEIPEEWKIYRMEELVKVVSGYSYKGSELVSDSEKALVTLKSFDRSGGFKTRGFKPFIGNPKDTQKVNIGDLVVAHTDLTQDAEVLGNPAFIFEDGGFEKMFITMDLVKVNSLFEEINNSFLYFLMKDRRFKYYCKGCSNGTTVLHLSKKAVPEYEIALPLNFEVIKKCSDVMRSFTNKISNNYIQIKTLTKTRDSLLPKLMNGEIRVKN